MFIELHVKEQESAIYRPILVHSEYVVSVKAGEGKGVEIVMDNDEIICPVETYLDVRKALQTAGKLIQIQTNGR